MDLLIDVDKKQILALVWNVQLGPMYGDVECICLGWCGNHLEISLQVFL